MPAVAAVASGAGAADELHHKQEKQHVLQLHVQEIVGHHHQDLQMQAQETAIVVQKEAMVVEKEASIANHLPTKDLHP